MITLDNAWNSQDWTTFNERHADNVAVFWVVITFFMNYQSVVGMHYLLQEMQGELILLSFTVSMQ